MTSVYFKFLAIALSALFPLINPVGSALVFLTMVGPVPRGVIRSLAKRIAISTTLFLLIVDLGGAGNSEAVRNFLAGRAIGRWTRRRGDGLALLERERHLGAERARRVGGDPAALRGKVFYPFTFPVTAGPGTLVVTLTLSAHASKRPLVEAAFAHFGIFTAVVLQCIVVLLLLRLCGCHRAKSLSADGPRNSAGCFLHFVLHRSANRLESAGRLGRGANLFPK